MSEISGFGEMGLCGAIYEGTCQGIKRDVLLWFKNNPEAFPEAVMAKDASDFLKLYPGLRTIMAKSGPSAAQAYGSFWAAVEELKQEKKESHD